MIALFYIRPERPDENGERVELGPFTDLGEAERKAARLSLEGVQHAVVPQKPETVRAGRRTLLEIAADPACGDEDALRQLAKLGQSELTIERDGCSLDVLTITAKGLRWVGPRCDWAEARKPYLRAAMSRAS